MLVVITFLRLRIFQNIRHGEIFRRKQRVVFTEFEASAKYLSFCLCIDSGENFLLGSDVSGRNIITI